MRPVYFTPSFTKTAKTNLYGNIWKLTRYSLHSRLAFFVGSQSFSKYPSVQRWLRLAGRGPAAHMLALGVNHCPLGNLVAQMVCPL